MHLIVCLDENGGMTFNNRRQSKDKMLIEDVMKLTENHRLFVSEYSSKLFEGENVIVDNDLLKNAKEDDFCFVEKEDVFEAIDKINDVVIYNWNRAYPSDKKFPKTAVLNKKTLVETTDFTGTSHEKITREIYK